MCRGRQRFASGRPAYLRCCTCRACVNEWPTLSVCVCVSPYNDCATRCATGCQCAAAPQFAAHSNCEFECLNCILFVANSLLQQLKANFAAHHRHPPSAPCSTATTAGSALGFLINAAGGDIHRTWQRRASSKHQGARSTAHRAALAFLLYFRFATKIARHFANVGCRN